MVFIPDMAIISVWLCPLKELEFDVGDLFLKVSPIKIVVWFGKKGNLSPRYVGPYF